MTGPEGQYMWQVTASYFASGKQDARLDKADTARGANLRLHPPGNGNRGRDSFDPDLADNDQRLNRA